MKTSLLPDEIDSAAMKAGLRKLVEFLLMGKGLVESHRFGDEVFTMAGAGMPTRRASVERADDRTTSAAALALAAGRRAP
ncbi:MAG: hypothetical protein OEL76_11715 [Siculibacillus sp.]|nr:hypothetical protein [Siculibacillus sp.]